MYNGNEVIKAMNGDSAAMEYLYKATYPKLRAVTVSILKNEDDAEDIIQETYIKAFTSFSQLDDAGKFEPWLCRIASNKCKDYLKKHKPALFSEFDKDEDEDPYEWSIEDESKDSNPEEVAITDDTRRQLMELVNSLPDEQRICLVYYAVEEMKISEIAELLEVSESTVKSRLKYAKDKMKAKIEDLEKKGIKLRGLSGLAIIPFVYRLFVIEAKAAIPAAVSFGPVAEGVPVAVYQVATNDDAAVSSHHSESSGKKENGSNKHGGNFVQDGYVNEVDELNAMIDFDEMVILDTEDYSVKVLNVRIDEAYNYILESEATNKLGNDIRIFSYPCFIDGVYSNVEMSVEVEANKTEKFEIKVHNPDLINYYKKYTEIKLRLQHTEIDGINVLANHKSVYAEPIYPFGKENKKEFDIGNNYKEHIFTDDNASVYIANYCAEEMFDGSFRCTLIFYLENKTDTNMYYRMDNLLVNDVKVPISYLYIRYKPDYFYNVDDTEYDEIFVPKNGSMFYKIGFSNRSIRDKVDIWDEEEIETVTFDGELWESGNEENVYFDDVITVDPEILKNDFTAIVDCRVCHEKGPGKSE